MNHSQEMKRFPLPPALTSTAQHVSAKSFLIGGNISYRSKVKQMLSYYPKFLENVIYIAAPFIHDFTFSGFIYLQQTMFQKYEMEKLRNNPWVSNVTLFWITWWNLELSPFLYSVYPRCMCYSSLLLSSWFSHCSIYHCSTQHLVQRVVSGLYLKSILPLQEKLCAWPFHPLPLWPSGLLLHFM